MTAGFNLTNNRKIDKIVLDEGKKLSKLVKKTKSGVLQDVKQSNYGRFWEKVRKN